MADLVSRYPGAWPFSDDDTSRLVFRGRQREIRALLDLVLAHRLVVVYAKSGLGKTSLLQAGLAEPLRGEHCLPVFVRFNDVTRKPLASLLEQVGEQAVKQGVECRADRTVSLWHYFKTAEFWRGDVLLTPVLVLDQFEELFTRHTPDARAEFLRDLGALVRGVRPTWVGAADADERPLSERPPEVRVLISLREDFLGSLEEAAESIPQILDHRFRLKPLGVEGAAEAIEAPAAVEDRRFSTRPFSYAPGTVSAIVAHLSQRANEAAGSTGGHVEPFHLQLICQCAETMAAARQKQGIEAVTITFDDLGGVPGLARTLRDFYTRTMQSMRGYGVRRKVQRLCAEYLINPEGRRLSVERGEIERVLRLQGQILQELVDLRLLRSDQRADRWYFELSHDSLVQPILATRRVRGLALGWVGLIASVLLGVMVFVLLAGGLLWISTGSGGPVAFTALFGVPFVALALWLAILGVRRSTETLNRYAPSTAGRPAQEWRRAVPVPVWLICAYAALVALEWLFSQLRGNAAEGPRFLYVLEGAKTAAIVVAAVALLRLQARAVLLFGVTLICTILVVVVGYSFYVDRYDNPALVMAAALLIGFEAAIVGYVRWLRSRQVLR